MEMYYYRVFTKTNGAPIKTSIGPDIDLDRAIKILHNTYDTTFDTTNAFVAPVTDQAETKLIDEQLPIRIKGFKAEYYIRGDTADVVTVTCVLHRATTGETYICDVTVPCAIANMDCTGEAIQDLLTQIANDYWATDEGKSLYPNGITWNEATNLPDAFLKRYGVTIEPIDTYAVINVAMDKLIAGPNPANDE